MCTYSMACIVKIYIEKTCKVTSQCGLRDKASDSRSQGPGFESRVMTFLAIFFWFITNVQRWYTLLVCNTCNFMGAHSSLGKSGRITASRRYVVGFYPVAGFAM